MIGVLKCYKDIQKGNRDPYSREDYLEKHQLSQALKYEKR